MIYLLPTCLSLTEKSPAHETFPVASSSPPTAVDMNEPVVLSLSLEMRVHLWSHFISLDYKQVDSIKISDVALHSS